MDKPTRQELLWALKVITEGENIWNFVNSSSDDGEKLGDILDRLEPELEEVEI